MSRILQALGDVWPGLAMLVFIAAVIFLVRKGGGNDRNPPEW